MSTLCYPAPVVKSSPADTDAPDYTPSDAPGWEDVQWWGEHCPKDGGCHPDELTPDEQADELEWLDYLNARYEAAYEQDRYETGIPCW